MTDLRICAVVVAYRPDLETITSVLNTVKQQVSDTIVVDNGNDEQVADLCRELSLQYVSFSQNQGLASAQNHGIDYAIRTGASHVLLMDQDSVPVGNMVDKLCSAEKQLRLDGVDKIGAIGARYIGRHATNESFFVRFGWFKFKRVFCSETKRRYVRADFLISSGTLIPRDALDNVGLMDEGLFIDHIDTDWFLRANHYGYYSFGACDATMEHSLGERTVRIWLGRWRYLPTHKPFRYYYMFRNSLLLYRRPYAPFKWILNDFVRLGFILVFYSLFVRPRLSRLKMIARGFIDGLRDKRGGIVATQPGA